jgi:hypothetical protein
MKTLMTILLLFTCTTLFAHTGDLNTMTGLETNWLYFTLGFQHILPLGIDHILFIAALFFFQPKFKPVLLQASIFTVAHTVTLLLAMTGKINPDPQYIEPLIALSIVFIAIENILIKQISKWRYLIVFGFGLIHGCGFASSLQQLGMPEHNFITALLSFNAGIEAGQILLMLGAFLLITKWSFNKTWYRTAIMIPVSCIIGCIALFWTIERTFLI